jgi:hypothetical protein
MRIEMTVEVYESEHSYTATAEATMKMVGERNVIGSGKWNAVGSELVYSALIAFDAEMAEAAEAAPLPSRTTTASASPTTTTTTCAVCGCHARSTPPARTTT